MHIAWWLCATRKQAIPGGLKSRLIYYIRFKGVAVGSYLEYFILTLPCSLILVEAQPCRLRSKAGRIHVAILYFV